MHQEITKNNSNLYESQILIAPIELFLQNLTVALEKLSSKIEQNIKGTKIQKNYKKDNDWLSKFVVYKDLARIKIEANIVLRETLWNCENKELCKKAQLAQYLS